VINTDRRTIVKKKKLLSQKKLIELGWGGGNPASGRKKQDYLQTKKNGVRVTFAIKNAKNPRTGHFAREPVGGTTEGKSKEISPQKNANKGTAKGQQKRK